MRYIKELFNTKKFYDTFGRANRCTSHWDDTRTDQDIFISRTLNKWFKGKFFQIEEEDWYKTKGQIFYSVKYIYIYGISFAFSRMDKVFKVYYIEPHSTKLFERNISENDLSRIKIIENESDYRILNKFYPVRIEEQPDPFAAYREQLEVIKTNHNESKKRQVIRKQHN